MGRDVTGQGGAIKNEGIMGAITGDFINNSAIRGSADLYSFNTHGGAIYTDTDLTLRAKDGYISVISGNYVEDANGRRQEGIYVDKHQSEKRLAALCFCRYGLESDE